MATLTIRDLDEALKAELRVRAARNGRSMEAEVRQILRAVLSRTDEGVGMASRIRRRFADVAEAPLPVPERTERPRKPEIPG